MNAPASLTHPTVDALKSSKQGQFAYEDVQHAIEQLYDLRSKVIRIGLLGTLLHRPDPDRPTTEAEREDFLTLLTSEVGIFNEVIAVLETGTPARGIHPLIARWMRGMAEQNRDYLRVALQVNTLSLRVLKAAKTGSQDQSAALIDHRKAARDHFHHAVTELCLSMWRDYDKDQSNRLDKAQAAADTLSGRLNRLERIGTHVRLVSINASVEAARIGTDGQGLSQIAQEFKGLAEEVKKLAQSARKDVQALRATE